jgi:hypothetical protein
MVNKSGRKPPAGCEIKGPRPTGHSAAILTLVRLPLSGAIMIYILDRASTKLNRWESSSIRLCGRAKTKITFLIYVKKIDGQSTL